MQRERELSASLSLFSALTLFSHAHLWSLKLSLKLLLSRISSLCIVGLLFSWRCSAIFQLLELLKTAVTRAQFNAIYNKACTAAARSACMHAHNSSSIAFVLRMPGTALITESSRSSSGSCGRKIVSICPHRLLAFSNVRPGKGKWPTGLTMEKVQSLMTSRTEKGTQDLMRWCMIESMFIIWGRLGAESIWVWLSHIFSAWPCESGVAT